MDETFTIALCLLSAMEVYKTRKAFLLERQRVAKYPFFKLRDKVIYQVLVEKNPDQQLLKLYEKVNDIVQVSERINFSFVSQALSIYVEKVLSGQKPDARPTPLELELGLLIFNTAKKNSLLLRLAVTKAGRVIFLWPFIKGSLNHQRKNRYIRATRDIQILADKAILHFA